MVSISQKTCSLTQKSSSKTLPFHFAHRHWKAVTSLNPQAILLSLHIPRKTTKMKSTRTQWFSSLPACCFFRTWMNLFVFENCIYAWRKLLCIERFYQLFPSLWFIKFYDFSGGNLCATTFTFTLSSFDVSSTFFVYLKNRINFMQKQLSSLMNRVVIHWVFHEIQYSAQYTNWLKNFFFVNQWTVQRRKSYK